MGIEWDFKEHTGIYEDNRDIVPFKEIEYEVYGHLIMIYPEPSTILST